MDKKKCYVCGKEPLSKNEIGLTKKLIDKKMSRTDLKEKSGISTVSLAKLGKNENLTTAVLVKICNALDCDV